MCNILTPTVTAALLLAAASAQAQPLAGTDELGRTILQNDAVGNPKSDKQVAMFYFLCQGDNTAEDYWDLTEIVAAHPEVLEDYDNPWWGTPVYYPDSPRGVAYFWGQPIYGYYRADDYWVHLRSMQLLADAMVDLVVIDATNHPIFPKESDALMRAMETVRKQGKNPPKIVYYTNTGSGERMQQVYDAYYKEGAPYRYPDCWYYLDGKPLIIGIREQAKGTEYESFFTFRESQWPNEPDKVNGWPWISFDRPQRLYYNEKGEAEIINVAVAQHPNWEAGMGGSAFYGCTDNWGRSYRNGSPGNPEKDIFYGYNIGEQWDYAIKQNTPFIFVTGWNEWTAGRWTSHDDNPEHSWFCDLASPEFSRDLEPSLTAGLKDHYYMQLVSDIRRYKGVEKMSVVSARTIKGMADWNGVPMRYTDYIEDTTPRNHAAAISRPKTVYTNNTGRNDLHILKAAHDDKNLWFYAQTAADITPVQGDNWMVLYLDTDRSHKTGWFGYDYRVIRGKTLQQYDGGSWKDAGNVQSEVAGNRMMVSIPRSMLKKLGKSPDIEFKWSDNMQEPDPMDWYVNGDAAPGGRFNYIYTAK